MRQISLKIDICKLVAGLDRRPVALSAWKLALEATIRERSLPGALLKWGTNARNSIFRWCSTTIEPGKPVCSVFGTGPGRDEAFDAMTQKASEVKRYLRGI